MKLFLLAFLPIASQAEDHKCYTGTVTANGKEMTKDVVMKEVEPLVGASIVSTIHSSKGLEDFMKTRGQCQAECLQEMMGEAVSTLYGKLGTNFFEADDVSIEALTGAFRACYPSPPRDAIHELAEKVIKSIGAPPAKNVSFPRGIVCKNAEHEEHFPLKQILKEFGDAFEEVISKDKDAKKFFSEVAKDCQLPCLEKTVSLSIKTLVLTGQEDPKVHAAAITGAMHACFPGVDSKDIEKMVDGTMIVMKNAQGAATTRLYATNMMNWGSYSSLTSGSIVTAMSFALFSAGVAVGRRWNRSPNREVENDQQSLLAP